MAKKSISPFNLRVLFITRTYPPVIGGMEMLSYYLTTTINCKKKIVALKKWNRLHILWFFPYAFFMAILNSKNFDIIHFSDGLTASLTIPLKIILKRNIFVSNVHGLDINFQNKKGLLPKIYGIYIQLLVKKQPHLWIANSKSTQMLALNAGLKNVKIIFPGIKTVEFYDGLHQNCLVEILGEKYNPKNVYILTLGRLTKRKGQTWFIENVLLKLPAHVHYIVAGKSYIMEGQKEDHVLKESVLKNGLADRVIFIDAPSDKIRLRLLSACKLFVMPNIPVEGDIEGFGIVALEAGVSGTIVVASALEGIQDAVMEGVTGYLVESENPHGFITQISDLITDTEFIDTQGAAARKYIKRNFDWKRVAEKYLQAFAEKKQDL